ncbi:hypothetical protein Q3G72_021955 [Acer saccharum]|nr:hypothetical protein Q3G72_021955 [Acer saccharum]
MKQTQSKVLLEGLTPEFSEGQEENQPSLEGNEAQIQNLDTLEDGAIDGLQDNNTDMGQMVVYAHPTETSDGESSVLKKRSSNSLKTYNMQTRNSKKGDCRKVAVDGELVVNKVSWNLDDEMARVVEESMAVGSI